MRTLPGQLAALAAGSASGATRSASESKQFQVSVFFAVMALVASLGQSVARATGRLRIPDYLLPARDARAAALQAYATYQPGCVCVVSGTTESLLDVLGNDVGFVDVQLDPPMPGAGQPVLLRIRPRRASGEYVVATTRVDLGDGTTTAAARRFGDIEIAHTYARPGEYRVETLIRSTGGVELRNQLVVRVTPP